MKKNRHYVLWVFVEILLAIVIHWLLVGKSRRFARARAWIARARNQGADSI
jgi:hypothetical protein